VSVRWKRAEDRLVVTLFALRIYTVVVLYAAAEVAEPAGRGGGGGGRGARGVEAPDAIASGPRRGNGSHATCAEKANGSAG